MSRYKEKYINEIRPLLMKKLGYKNLLEVPRLVKVVVNVGVGEATQNSHLLDVVAAELALITGQKAKITRARKSVAAFKVRQGNPIGCVVTLRGKRMYDFVDRFINIAAPRIRDFVGFSPEAFDGRGNYNIGLDEQIIFPEIDYDKVVKVRGMDITIQTTAETDEEALELLKGLGMPIRS